MPTSLPPLTLLLEGFQDDVRPMTRTGMKTVSEYELLDLEVRNLCPRSSEVK